MKTKYDLSKLFIPKIGEDQKIEPEQKEVKEYLKIVKTETNVNTNNWNDEIKELETFFAANQIPDTINLTQVERITNTKKMIESHLNYVKANNGNMRFLPYLDRLKKVKELITANQN